MQTSKGFSPIILVAILAVVIIAGGAAGAFYMKNNQPGTAPQEQARSFADKPKMADSLEAEIETIQVADPATDFAEVDKDIQQL